MSFFGLSSHVDGGGSSNWDEENMRVSRLGEGSKYELDSSMFIKT